MFCEKCGTPLLEGERFCPNCGAPVGAAKPDTFTPPAVNPQNPTPAMIRSIVAAALCGVPLVNLVLSIAARVKITTYYRSGGLPCGQSKTASALSKLALSLAIVICSFWLLAMLSAIFG